MKPACARHVHRQPDPVVAVVGGTACGEDIDAADGLADAVRAQLAEQLAASMNDDDDETDERP